jgi:hypothetical protein
VVGAAVAVATIRSQASTASTAIPARGRAAATADPGGAGDHTAAWATVDVTEGPGVEAAARAAT